MNTSRKKLWMIAVLGCLWLRIGLATAWAQAPAPLPFWLSYCADLTCGGLQPLVVHICPEANPSCTPSRQTTVVPQVDGRQINQILFPVQTPDGFTGTYVSGSGSVFDIGTLVISYTSPVIVKSDVDITLSYYRVAPVWGGTTSLNFVSSIMTSPEVVTTVYRYPTFLVNDEVVQLHEQGRNIISQESQIASINPGQMHAFFLPSEFATLGEGNFSDGNLNITINYGNPDYITALGSVYDTALPRFAHEYVHELFSEVSQNYPGNNSCLNEGLADAFAFAAGFLPEPDFGPIGLRGTDFNQGCAEIVENFEIHDAGNCPFWQVRLLGSLSQSFVGQMLHPQHIIEFDSCDLTSEHTGNALVVLFSEAAGRDMTQAIQMAEIPNAGSFEAAKQALGLITAVAIDIKPRSFPNSINPRSQGVIPVAILTTTTFDATTVDPLSVKFGPDGAIETHGRGHFQDVNRDGKLDLVLHFNIQDTGIRCWDTSASLTGKTFSGQPIQGSDSIKTVACK